MAVTRIGVLGGSFNPPHRAHRALAEAALQQLALDALLIVPAGQPWQKAGSDLAPAAQRLAMCELAFAGMPRVTVSPIEVERAEPSTTVATLERLQAERPGAEWWLVIGQDQYARLSTWKRVPELLGRCRLAVAARAGVALAGDPQLPPHVVQGLDLAPDAVSASAIRAALSRGEDISPLVGPEVAGYIAQHPLYGA